MLAAIKVRDLSLSPDKTHLIGCPFEAAGSYAKISPFKDLCFLVMHFTAGRGFDSTVSYFKDPANKVSAHLVVGRKGELVQMVPFDRPAWHAGAASTWTYTKPAVTNKQLPYAVDQAVVLKGMNFYSLGIEFDNYGPLRLQGKKIVTWFGHEVPSNEVVEVDPKARGSFGTRFWHAYSPLQLDLAERLATILVRGFGLRGVLGHSDILRGKTDPGPLFPLQHIAALVHGMSDEEPTT
jgi:N-acetylmuramoyl-L-alanine amidase